MAGMEIKIPDEQMAQLVGKQILDGMSQEVRDKIITDAIVALNKTSKSSHYPYEQEPSELQRAFNQAVYAAVNRLVQVMVMEDPTIQATIRTAVDGFIRIFPESWASEDVQQEVMGVVIRKMRERDS